MEQVRLGIIGLGWFGGELTEAARQTGLAEVVSCFARSTDRRQAFAEEHGCRAVDSLQSMLEDPGVEGVLIATPHTSHTEIIEQAASAGKHVFVEKPMTLTAEDAQRAIAATSEAGVTLQVGHNMRRQPANRRIKAMIDEGELGTVLGLQGFHSNPIGFSPDLPKWRRDPVESPVGGMTAFGVHTADTFHYFVGPAQRVAAFSKQVLGLLPIDEMTGVIIEYERGAVAMFGVSYLVAPRNSLAVYGTEASAWSEGDGQALYVQRRGDKAREERSVEPIDTVVDEMAEFARCIREGGRPETGGPEGLEVANVLEAIVESVATGKVVEVSHNR